MSAFASKVLEYYEKGLWSISRVQKALELSKLTQAEFDMIVGDIT